MSLIGLYQLTAFSCIAPLQKEEKDYEQVNKSEFWRAECKGCGFIGKQIATKRTLQ